MATAAVALIGRCKSVNRIDESGSEKKERYADGRRGIENSEIDCRIERSSRG